MREVRYSLGIAVVRHSCGHWILDDVYGHPIPCWHCHRGRNARRQTTAEAVADVNQSLRDFGSAVAEPFRRKR